MLMMTACKTILAIVLLGLSSYSFALENRSCFSGAANRFNVDETLLIAIAKKESSFNHKAIGRNKDGSEDYGLMQINSTHLPTLQRAGFSKNELFEPCTSIYIGAYILHGCIQRHGSTWRAVGCYNAGSRKNREAARLKYVLDVKRIYQTIKRRGLA